MLSLIIPTYNERGNILELINQVESSLRGVKHELIIVDDNSPDGTAKEARKHKSPNLRVLVRHGERGLSSAVVYGFKRARGDVLGVMDADLSHDPRILKTMFSQTLFNDLVIGVRERVSGWGLKRKLISYGATILAKLLLGVELGDPMSGYFMIKKTKYNLVKDSLNLSGFKILLELYARTRPITFKEVPFVFNNRVSGESKLTNNVIKDYLKQLLELRHAKNN